MVPTVGRNKWFTSPWEPSFSKSVVVLSDTSAIVRMQEASEEAPSKQPNDPKLRRFHKKRKRPTQKNPLKSGSLDIHPTGADHTQRRNLDSQYRTLFTRGMEEWKQKRWSTARQLFQSCAENEYCSIDTRSRCFLSWGRLEAQCGNWEAARYVFRKGVEVDSKNKHLFHAWAVFEERCGNVSKSRELFEQCIEADPSDGVSWQSYALLEERQGNIEHAEELMKKGLERDPHNPYLLQARGVLFSRKCQWNDAVAMFERAIAVHPNYYQAWQAMAVAQGKLGNRQTALSCFESALKICPTSVPTYQAYAMFEAECGNYEHARSLFQKGSELDSCHAPIFHAWAKMEERIGNIDKARELYEKGFRYSPQSLAILRGWTLLERRLGHLPDSIEWKVTDTSHTETSHLGERLFMLGKMVEGKSESDIRIVLEWLATRARNDQNLRIILQQRGMQDLRKVLQWAERRSSEDIRLFVEWFNERYEEDRSVAALLFGWQLPKRTKEIISQAPPEWYFVSKLPKSLSEGDDLCYYQSNLSVDYCQLVYFLGGFADRVSSRVAQVTILIGLTASLLLGSIQLGLFEVPLSEVVDIRLSPVGVDSVILQEDMVGQPLFEEE
ncbi:PsbB mRNA maturation factor Mbb1 [Galdieria sulphuraria]|uniref:PsbB mRNA maturation factor Mbb1 n=1 Tax=Galdieria sulphuraria TaxID=130081 RepID=M2XTQ4_GALSU|nr:PsbB mRNA maturation factor Mbb1 [Galdieria sulphuraria]EME27048.1 PsbB mRNA maturation factor Mbb1 [Galdieria sulphuraria]|eukprot:XP_005703568.1 PsbB mRNA maturation factor Mbb1 [Galdieria sulphuraria]